jgi:NRE family putative nickel resistance protein-like MFS transporter
VAATGGRHVASLCSTSTGRRSGTRDSTALAGEREPDIEPIAAERERVRARTDQRAAAGYREVLAIPAFRRLWMAQLLAAFGEALAAVALPLLAYGVTGSAELTSWVVVAQLLPRVALAPIAGVLADRVDRRRLILTADLGRALVVVLFPFADQAWQIGTLALLVAVGSALARPAELAAVPAVVGPGQLVQALSASQVAGGIVRVGGPAVGAAIVGLAGPGPAFLVQAICFATSFLVVLGLVLPPVTGRSESAATAAAALRRDVVAGLGAVWRIPVVRGTAAVEALWQTVTAVFSIALVVYVETTLHLGEAADSVYALLMATFSAGATGGALVAGRIERRLGRPRLMAIGYLAPLMLLPAGLAPPPPVLFACWFVLGFTDAWAVIAMQAYLAEAVPDRLRGRVYAIWGAVVTAGGAVAAIVVGQLTPVLGPAATIALVGAVVGLGGPLLLVVSEALAALRRPATD